MARLLAEEQQRGVQASAAATREDRRLRPVELEHRLHLAAGVARVRCGLPAAARRCADLSQRHLCGLFPSAR